MATVISRENPIFQHIFVNPDVYFTSERQLQLINPYDAALFIVGVVHGADKESNRILNKETGETGKVFNFRLLGHGGIVIHLCAWQDIIPRIQKDVRKGNCLLIDGPFAKPTDPQYTPDNRRYQLTIRSNTRIIKLVDANPASVLVGNPQEEIAPIPYTSFQEMLKAVIDKGECIIIDVWLDQDLRYKSKRDGTAICAVRDDNTLVVLHLSHYSEAENKFEEGDKITVLAQTAFDDNGMFYLEGRYIDLKLISKNDDSYYDLDVATTPGKRVKIEDTNEKKEAEKKSQKDLEPQSVVEKMSQEILDTTEENQEKNTNKQVD